MISNKDAAYRGVKTSIALLVIGLFSVAFLAFAEGENLGPASLRASLSIVQDLDQNNPDRTEENWMDSINAVTSVQGEATPEATALAKNLEEVLDNFKGNLLDADSFPSDDEIPIDRNKIIKVFILDSGAAPEGSGIVYASKAEVEGIGNGIEDNNGHGTTVARIVLDTAEMLGIAENIELHSIKIFYDTEDGITSNQNLFGLGMYQAIENGADVINFSTETVGGTSDEFILEDSSAIYDYAQVKGVSIVTAAGNYGDQTALQLDKLHPTVISVGALDKEGKPAYWLFAESGTSGLRQDAPTNLFADDDGYAIEITGEIESGTSFASPRVAAVVAQVKLRPIDSFYDINQNEQWDTAEVEFFIRVNINRSQYKSILLRDGLDVVGEYWGSQNAFLQEIQQVEEPTFESVPMLRNLLSEFFVKFEEASAQGLEESWVEPEKTMVSAAIGFSNIPSLRELLSYLFPFFDERPVEKRNPETDVRPYSFYGLITQGFNFLKKPFSERARQREFAGVSGLYTIRYVDSLIDESLEKVYGADRVLLDSLLRLGISDAALRSNTRTDILFKILAETEAALQNDIFAAIIRVAETEEAPSESQEDLAPENLEKESEFIDDASKQGRPALLFTARQASPGKAILKWTSSGAIICTGYNFETDRKTSGEVTVSLSKVTTYAITCLAKNGNSAHHSIEIFPGKEEIINISVPGAVPPTTLFVPPPTVTLKALSDFTGRKTKLTWESKGATTCASEQFKTDGKTEGSAEVTQTADTTYLVSCTGPGGTIGATASVDVLESFAQPKDPVISIKQSSKNALITWDAPVETCTIVGTDGFSYVTSAKTGSVNAGPLKSGTTNYSITCEVAR